MAHSVSTSQTASIGNKQRGLEWLCPRSPTDTSASLGYNDVLSFLSSSLRLSTSCHQQCGHLSQGRRCSSSRIPRAGESTGTEAGTVCRVPEAGTSSIKGPTPGEELPWRQPAGKVEG